MTNEIISTWQGIASYLGITVEAVKRMAKEHKDFPVIKMGRMWTTKNSLVRWVEKRVESLEK